MAVNSGRKRKTAGRKRKKKEEQRINYVKKEIFLLAMIAVAILLLISSFGFGGMVGNAVSSFFFGLFGFLGYFFPVILVLVSAFLISNWEYEGIAIKVKAVFAVVLFFCLCFFLELISGQYDQAKTLARYYKEASISKSGGGLVGGLFCRFSCPLFGVVGTYVFLIILIIICMVVITEKSFLNGVKKGGSKVVDTAKRENERRKERQSERREQRRDRKVKGVTMNTLITDEPVRNQEMKEITPKQASPFYDFTIQRNDKGDENTAKSVVEEVPDPQEDFPVELPFAEVQDDEQPVVNVQTPKSAKSRSTKNKNTKSGNIKPDNAKLESAQSAASHQQKTAQKAETSEAADKALDDIPIQRNTTSQMQSYKHPPLDLLSKGSGKISSDSDAHLRETARKLQQTLHNFGVNVTITNVTCGPTITRYELQPEQGVKVNRIVSLADDIKLNLAATDIRIEAPIPGKAAVGIEVPNEENSTVMFRDLLESAEFKKHPSKLSFAAGKDIAGQVLIADIAKMPHLLIAGATGSGKSVCINTLIMSILYKAKPDEVKLIMIDPKVVELSVYNGIPHLMIPVVTDPKKAAGALNWAVAEMEDRYQKFAEYNVRDLKGYNKKIESIDDIEDDEKPQKLPQIVIIVDELADLMMVASGEVEESICRLAQLARAAGLHLIIATQRPSVNVITGLIKANMPSKIAFAVSSGVDSRTIIGMNGAEKLLGKGDMLFYPQNYPKPVRAQGAFISDKEVSKVVEFLAQQNAASEYSIEIEEKINNAQLSAQKGESGGAQDRDQYFVDAGRFIIEKDKASIGMLQRMFKIGFNRAARIMDQLADADVVGPEEGTKPRKVLMSMEEFEAYIDEYV